eukprot:NODE_1952_length_715_cov_1082.522523_g1644_i0.p1 GENE.NODE_1952_length_715_cov_1082.522523_g1644_i0~~NODE_1952_length_715_cov_1082.522523_g1644_i0.p1  ORF type:complete len:136 (+),score=42.15 NODE_1952_length_715_cov_1082.522523_g1644_i0:87-494(+)
MGTRRVHIEHLGGIMKVKAHELRQKGRHELLKQLEDLRTELAQLRVAQQTGGAAAKLAKIKVVRKSIARVLTVNNQKEKQNLRKAYKGKTFKPKDLRLKLTRAKRRALKPYEISKSLKQQKREKAFPVRKFAIKL